MSTNREGVKPNPALEPISFFIGAWDKFGQHPLILDLDVHVHARAVTSGLSRRH